MIRESFTKNGYKYNLVTKSNTFAIFSQEIFDWCLYYEVIICQNLKEANLPGGRIREAGEYYPSSELWGTSGWTYRTIEDAYVKFNELCNRKPKEATKID